MLKFFEKLLKAKIESSRKPYDHSFPAFSDAFCQEILEIKKEWGDFVRASESKGLPIDDLSDAQKSLNEDKKWKSLFLFGYSYYNTALTPHFPVTMTLIRKYESQITLAMFSTTEPGKHIPAHKGNNHGVLRLQIGIDIKESDQCFLRVEDKILYLKEGERFVFDDTFEHELGNQSNADRTVLIIDFYKPLPVIYDRLNRKKMDELKKSNYIQSVIKKLTN